MKNLISITIKNNIKSKQFILDVYTFEFNNKIDDLHIG